MCHARADAQLHKPRGIDTVERRGAWETQLTHWNPSGLKLLKEARARNTSQDIFVVYIKLIDLVEEDQGIRNILSPERRFSTSLKGKVE